MKIKGCNKGSFYGLFGTIYLMWHEEWEENAFRVLINDVDHECFHKILADLEGINTSYLFDRTLLQLELGIGFLSDSFVPFLIKVGFGEKLELLRLRWEGKK